MKKKIYNLFVKLGKATIIMDILLLISITIFSFSIKGEVNYGNRCYHNNELDFINDFDYDGITMENLEIKCNTCYIRYKSNLDKEKNILFLNSLSKLLYDNDKTIDVQVNIETSRNQLIASIVNYEINVVETSFD